MYFNINYRSSSAVRAITVNPISGEVIVSFNNGLTYSYERVNRLAILNLLANDNMSLGFWVNANCLSYDSGAVAYAVA